MLTYPAPDPVAFHIGSWPVYWYGLMYLFSFMIGWGLLSLRLRLRPQKITQEELSDIIFYAALGVILGGRIGYILFYDWQIFLSEPLLIFQIWKGGMSFHGGLLGVIFSLWFYCRKSGIPLLILTDFIAPIVPIGLAAGRIGNFINGELIGRVTHVPWGMIFPLGGALARHPSQLYEFLLEGVLLFAILWTYSRKSRPAGAISGSFLLFYGILRFSVEFFREPDPQIGYIAGWMTEGQILSIPMICAGAILILWAYHWAQPESLK